MDSTEQQPERDEWGPVYDTLLDGAGALNALARALKDGLLTMPTAHDSAANVLRDAFIVTLGALDRSLFIVGQSAGTLPNEEWCSCPVCGRVHLKIPD